MGMLGALNQWYDGAYTGFMESSPGLKRYEGKLFNKATVGGMPLMLGMGLLSMSQLWKPENLGNGRIHRNSGLEKMGGITTELANIGLSLVPAVMGFQMAKMGYDVGKMVLSSQTQNSQFQKRNFYRPNLAPLQSQRAFKYQQQGVSRVMDSMQFVGNEAKHIAARGA